jgi:hypothetical protein
MDPTVTHRNIKAIITRWLHRSLYQFLRNRYDGAGCHLLWHSRQTGFPHLTKSIVKVCFGYPILVTPLGYCHSIRAGTTRTNLVGPFLKAVTPGDYRS